VKKEISGKAAIAAIVIALGIVVIVLIRVLSPTPAATTGAPGSGSLPPTAQAKMQDQMQQRANLEMQYRRGQAAASTPYGGRH